MILIVQIILTVITSIAFGLLMGIIGGGGGGIYVLVLLVFLHQNVKTAAMTALVLSTITLSGAAWQFLPMRSTKARRSCKRSLQQIF